MSTKTAVKTKTYTATAPASNFHNWLLHYNITEDDLKDMYDGDEEKWLTDIQSGDVEPDETIDQGYGGLLIIDGPIDIGENDE